MFPVSTLSVSYPRVEELSLLDPAVAIVAASSVKDDVGTRKELVEKPETPHIDKVAEKKERVLPIGPTTRWQPVSIVFTHGPTGYR